MEIPAESAVLKQISLRTLTEDAAGDVEELQLICLRTGSIRLSIPELGGKCVQASHWALLSDLPGHSQWDIDSQTSGALVTLPLSVIRQLSGGRSDLPQRLQCLLCARRDASFFASGNLNGVMEMLVRSLCEEENKGFCAFCMQQSKALELLGRVLNHSSFREPSECRPEACVRDREALLMVANYLEQNLEAEHSLSDLSRRFYINEFKLKRGFREQYGTTVFGYLRRKRMEHAMMRLKQTGASVLEAATAVGYSNPSHFARAFRDAYGVNPGEIRR